MGQQNCGHWYKLCAVTALRKVRVAAWLFLITTIPGIALGHEESHGPHARGFDETFTLLAGGESHFADAYAICAHRTAPG